MTAGFRPLRSGHRTRIATVTVKIGIAGPVTPEIKLVLKRSMLSKRLKLVGVGSFKPAGRRTVTVSRHFTLK
jgi:hypothetical protein